MRIGIDFDGVMNDMLTPWCEILSQISRYNATADEISEWDLTKTFKDLSQHTISGIIRTPEFWSRVQPKQDAVNVIQKLIDAGHDVVVVTAAWPPESMATKFNICMQKYFPFINWRNVICTGRKDLVNVDVLIDDYPKNLKESHSAVKILFCTKYNKYAQDRQDLIPVHSWYEIEDIINYLVEKENRV